MSGSRRTYRTLPLDVPHSPAERIALSRRTSRTLPREVPHSVLHSPAERPSKIDAYFVACAGRIELFGQASLRLKNVSLSDKGVYQLFTVFSDGTSQTVTASVEVDDPCENNDCSPDGGRCVPHGNNFTCMCDPGYVGDGRICTEVTTQSGTTIPTTNVMKEFPFGFTELQATAEIPPTIGDSAVTTAARKSSVRNTTAGSHSTLAGNGMTKTIQGSVRNTTGLLLRAVRLTDAGTYELLVAFDDASESMRKDSHLVVHYPPRFLDITPSVTAVRGSQVILQAHASCIPPPTYSWIKVNGSVPETSIENTTTGTLTLRNIGPKDGGTYMAIASNSLGIASNLSVLKVENLPEDTSSEEFSIEEVLTIAAVPCVTVLSVMAGVLLYCWIRKRRNKEQTLDMSEVTFHPDLPPLPAALPQPPPIPSRPQFLKYEINRTDLDVKERIGSGAFEDSGEEEIKNFIREIDTTMNLTEHINLLGLIGCVTVTRPPYMVTDYMPYGDLKNFLLKCRKLEERRRDSTYDLTEFNIYQVTRQIANGMTFISQAGYVHGDLAARNVLVGENLVVKIADFGLTTDIYERGYQRQDAEQKIPLRWMAPERLLREGRYTSKSDVYSMMLRCWEWDEDNRPDFEELYQELDAVLESMTNGYMKPRCSWTDSWTEASENSGCSSSTEAVEPPGSSSSVEVLETPGNSSSAEVLETPGRSSSIGAVDTPGISSSAKNPQSSVGTETPGISSSSEAAKNTGSSISTEAVEKPGSAYDIPRAARMRLQVATGICNGNGYHEELEMDSIRVRKHMSL
ncbi:regulation of mast cell degranulation [Branchiostoma belcheri]|nr:regulation of mast cell degranulation [Branchiostoma belcheri]